MVRTDPKLSRTSAYKVRINTDSADSNALILLADGALVAILVELEDECHGADRGKWTIESAYGVDGERMPANFPAAIDAADWLSSRGTAGRFLLNVEVPELR